MDIIEGRNNRLAIMVGPCSIHNVAEAIEYGKKLRELALRVKDTMLVVMRVYFEKPRTTTGWKGLITDPHLDGTDDMNSGLKMARSIMQDISEIGLPIVTEFLDPRVPRYISDLVTMGTIGARTTESQTHREMASGLSMPVGFKNSTDGTVKNALDAFVAAKSSHKFLGINMQGEQKMLTTAGNPHGCIILRGGNGHTNYDPVSVEAVVQEVAKRNLRCPIVVDCSHGNSYKQHQNQAMAFTSIIDQVVQGRKEIVGAMLESNLLPGNQKFDAGSTSVRGLSPGISITDSCIGWEETESLILDAHHRLKR
jgi:3-deoxy-7-phosphoheptulonate synthase